MSYMRINIYIKIFNDITIKPLFVIFQYKKWDEKKNKKTIRDSIFYDLRIHENID